MSALAPTLQAFFTERLIRQRQVSAHTIASYRDTLRLLLVGVTRAEFVTGSVPGSRRWMSTLSLLDLES